MNIYTNLYKKLKNIYSRNQNSFFLNILIKIRRAYYRLINIKNIFILKRKGFKVINNSPIKYESSLELDVVYCTIERDLDILNLSLKSLRKNLMHPINKIYIVAPDSEKIIKFCNFNDCIFIDEDKNFPFKLKDINYKLDIDGKSYDHSGWIFQQLLTLSGDLFCEKQHYFVLDSDTLLSKPQSFEFDGRYIFNYGDWIHKPYDIAYKKLTGRTEVCPISLVSHMMIFNKDILNEMKKSIETNTGEKWYEAIISYARNSSDSTFSEYQSYGQYVAKNYSHLIFLSYWYNISCFRGQEGISFNDKKIKSISYHHYNN